ncbi:hypothetical protein JI435_405400 [Parastagonospora nodorum SN15]|uniref:Zn(2)-C6 fungal-type domain-containing protein n=1 Tax=Phaeosphaeria nodorum (strain SN15 / ATCC MYA-4574 / FGSC 10173) TaxID=321614 RepID=A0A7U2F0D3_PHANO|nr:hypothetical protein JI435_405400 [Parastagonospora nodorum SN15]
MAVSPTTTQIAEPQKVVEATTNNAAAAPRKRRRRAPATGATEDCFSCKKRQLKCDRRRPYCGQCVEIGKECSGYRTTLTWGVGVASRGKLRGMSLPIAKSPPAVGSQEPKNQTRKNSTASASTTSTGTTQQHAGNFSTRGSMDFGIHSPTSPTTPMYSAPQEYQYFSATSPIAIPSPSTPMGFPMQHHGDHFEFLRPQSKMNRPQARRGPLQRLQTTLHTPYEENGMSASSASLGTYSDSDFPSPSDYPQTPVDEFPFADPSIPRYSSVSSHDQGPFGSLDSFFLNEAARSLPMADDMSSSVSSDQSIHDYVEVNSAQQNMGPPAYPDIFSEGEMSSSFTGFQPGFSFLPSEESCNRYAPFPADVIPSGLLRQIYMPGTGGF